jgi:hypothetical protein
MSEFEAKAVEIASRTEGATAKELATATGMDSTGWHGGHLRGGKIRADPGGDAPGTGRSPLELS